MSEDIWQMINIKDEEITRLKAELEVEHRAHMENVREAGKRWDVLENRAKVAEADLSKCKAELEAKTTCIEAMKREMGSDKTVVDLFAEAEERAEQAEAEVDRLRGLIIKAQAYVEKGPADVGLTHATVLLSEALTPPYKPEASPSGEAMTVEQSELIQARARILELQAELELSRKETKRQSEQLSSASIMLTNVVPQEAYDAVWKEKEQAEAEVARIWELAKKNQNDGLYGMSEQSVRDQALQGEEKS